MDKINVRGLRLYKINDRYLPSVTTILSFRNKHPALLKWRASITEEQEKQILEYTSNRGTLVHWGALRQYETETVIQEEKPHESVAYMKEHPQMREEVRVALKLFREFKQQYKLTPVALEKVVWSIKHNFAGTIDFAGYLHNEKNGSKVPVLLDIKTSKDVYTESLSLQLAGYQLAIGKRAKHCYVLVLHPGQTTIAGVTIGAEKPFWKFERIVPDYSGFLHWVDMFSTINNTLQSDLREQELIK